MTRAGKAELKLADFPAKTSEKVRWSDTDGLGHVNNMIFASYCEAGRIEMLRELGIFGSDRKFTIFIARLAIDFQAQITWPGTVEIGTGIKTIGRSSIIFSQAIFQNGQCAASAEIVVVHVNGAGTPTPIDDEIRERLTKAALISC